VDAAIDLPGEPGQARVARDHVRELLSGTPRVDDMLLITSELVTNALQHTPSGGPGGSFEVRLTGLADPESGWCRIAVRDDGHASRPERVPSPEELAESGRGMLIISQLASDFGSRSTPEGTLSWAEIRWGKPEDDEL
jgi:serine/threonine-protein kinase RsbW